MPPPPPPPGTYPPPPSGQAPRPSVPPTPIPAHAHPYYHHSPQCMPLLLIRVNCSHYDSTTRRSIPHDDASTTKQRPSTSIRGWSRTSCDEPWLGQLNFVGWVNCQDFSGLVAIFCVFFSQSPFTVCCCYSSIAVVDSRMLHFIPLPAIDRYLPSQTCQLYLFQQALQRASCSITVDLQP